MTRLYLKKALWLTLLAGALAWSLPAATADAVASTADCGLQISPTPSASKEMLITGTPLDKGYDICPPKCLAADGVCICPREQLELKTIVPCHENDSGLVVCAQFWCRPGCCQRLGRCVCPCQF